MARKVFLNCVLSTKEKHLKLDVNTKNWFFLQLSIFHFFEKRILHFFYSISTALIMKLQTEDYFLQNLTMDIVTFFTERINGLLSLLLSQKALL